MAGLGLMEWASPLNGLKWLRGKLHEVATKENVRRLLASARACGSAGASTQSCALLVSHLCIQVCNWLLLALHLFTALTTCLYRHVSIPIPTALLLWWPQVEEVGGEELNALLEGGWRHNAEPLAGIRQHPLTTLPGDPSTRGSRISEDSFAVVFQGG